MRMRWMAHSGALALALALSACGGGGSGTVSVTPTSGATSAASSPPSGCDPSSEQALVAAELTFDRRCMAVPAHHPTTLSFTNNDPGESHDVAIYRWDSCFSQQAFDGDPSTCAHPTEGLRYKGNIITQGQTSYHILGLRPGRYAFVCVVHPSMHGVFKVL